MDTNHTPDHDEFVHLVVLFETHRDNPRLRLADAWDLDTAAVVPDAVANSRVDSEMQPSVERLALVRIRVQAAHVRPYLRPALPTLDGDVLGGAE